MNGNLQQLLDLIKYIRYKIIGVFDDECEYVVQCLKSNKFFNAQMIDIIFDGDILRGLHPIQACHIGIEYSRHLKQRILKPVNLESQQHKLQPPFTQRYGCYYLHSRNRQGKLTFIDQNSKKQHTIDPRDIALSVNLIQNFDAIQAYYIGVQAGLKLNDPLDAPNDTGAITKKRHLRLIK